MSNLSIKVNLTKIKGAALVNLQGKTSKKQCIVIPVEDAGLYVGDKGVYLNLTAIGYREQKYEDSHFIKQSVSKEDYDAMSEEDRNAQPICGGVKPMIKQTNPMQPTGDMSFDPSANGDDLPF